MISRKMKTLDFHKISYILVSVDTVIVGVAGFEPATSCSQSRRDNRATLHPDNGYLFASANIKLIFTSANSFLVAERPGFEPGHPRRMTA